MKKLLFICSRNRLRSPTAEHVFAQYPGLETDSAGTNNDAVTPLSLEQVQWADIIFVMEKIHLGKVKRRFNRYLNGKRTICLDIPDDYEFMAPKLVALLKTKVERFLPSDVRGRI